MKYRRRWRAPESLAQLRHGIGSIIGNRNNRLLMEQEDFAEILSMWSSEDNRNWVLNLKSGYDLLNVIGRKGSTKLIGKSLAKHLAVNAGGHVSQKLITKVGAKASSKLFAKAAAGFVPAVGAAASGAINVWFVKTISDVSKDYFEWKNHVWDVKVA